MIIHNSFSKSNFQVLIVMADDIRASKESRQSFLSSFDDVDCFLEGSESGDDDIKTVDIEITTDLGSSTSLMSPTSPMPNLTKSFDGKRTPLQSYDPIAEEHSQSFSSPRNPPHSDTPLPHADTPLPKHDSDESRTESSDEITVHQDSDSLNTEALKMMAGMNTASSAAIGNPDRQPGPSSAPDIRVVTPEQSDSDYEAFGEDKKSADYEG